MEEWWQAGKPQNCNQIEQSTLTWLFPGSVHGPGMKPIIKMSFAGRAHLDSLTDWGSVTALRDVEFIEAHQGRAHGGFARLTTGFKEGTLPQLSVFIYK